MGDEECDAGGTLGVGTDGCRVDAASPEPWLCVRKDGFYATNYESLTLGYMTSSV